MARIQNIQLDVERTPISCAHGRRSLVRGIRNFFGRNDGGDVRGRPVLALRRLVRNCGDIDDA
jgi:hypothetical protein